MRQDPVRPLNPVPSTDSSEYFSQRIAELNEELQKLNILDHSQRIVEICNQIRVLKSEIAGISTD